MPQELIIEIACDASTEAWHRKTRQYGDRYVDENYDTFLEEVKEEVREAVEEAERDWHRDEAERAKAWEDEYYEENAYGFRQQDLIDLRRFER